MTFKRLLALFLVALMLTAVAAAATACGKDETPVTTDTTAAGDTTPAAETTESTHDAKGYLKDDLPRDLTFAKGDTPETFTVLGWKYRIPEFDVEELSGDVVENSLYERNRAVEERLGVDLVFDIIPGDASNFTDWCNTVSNAVNANAQAYDAVAGYLRSAGMLTVNHMLLDMLELDHLDFEKPWWSNTLVEMNTINDKLYFVSGDISTSLLYQMMILVYNTKLGTDLGLQNPQELVLNGTWTQEKFIETCSNVYQDLDNDGKKSKADQFGLFSVTLPNVDIFYMGGGLKYVVPDKETGELVMADDMLSEKSLAIIDRLIGLYHASNDGLLDGSAAISDNQFKSLYYNTTFLVLSESIRTSDMEYSILPAPKYDEAQEKYITCVTFGHTMYMVPIDAPNLPMTGAVLECLASEGYRKTTPAVFETAFKYQYSQSSTDSQIVEIIRDGVVFDICRAFHDQFSGNSPVTIWRTFPNGGQNTLASTQRVYTMLWTNVLKKLNTTLAEG